MVNNKTLLENFINGQFDGDPDEDKDVKRKKRNVEVFSNLINSMGRGMAGQVDLLSKTTVASDIYRENLAQKNYIMDSAIKARQFDSAFKQRQLEHSDSHGETVRHNKASEKIQADHNKAMELISALKKAEDNKAEGNKASIENIVSQLEELTPNLKPGFVSNAMRAIGITDPWILSLSGLGSQEDIEKYAGLSGDLVAEKSRKIMGSHNSEAARKSLEVTKPRATNTTEANRVLLDQTKQSLGINKSGEGSSRSSESYAEKAKKMGLLN